MGQYLRKLLGGDYASLPQDRIEDVAEASLQMHEQLSRDVLSLAEDVGLKKSHERVVRAKAILERLT